MSEITHKKPHIPDAIRSKHRLAEISHHFLSNENERSPAWQNTTIVPILLGSKQDDYIVYELNRSFNQQDGSSMVLNIESRFTPSSVSAPFPENPTDSSHDNREESGMPDYCLVPVTSPPTTLALQCDRFIIAVHASLGGVRVAYDQLAFMASLETDFDVCVIMLGAKNLHSAKRFFGFLCENAQSLLALELECGGFILQDSDNTSTSNRVAEPESANDDVATDLNSVAKGILRKYGRAVSPMSATHLSGPVGVAGLLS